MLKTEEVLITQVKSHPLNYREHPDDQLSHIIASIEQHGLYRNIVVAKDFTILAGHGVVKAARRMGFEKIPVIKLNIEADSSQALKLLAGDNEIGRLAVIDDRQLSELLKVINDTDIKGLLGTGFDDMMLASLVMVSRPSSEIRGMDEAAEWVGLPDYETGERGPQLLISFENEEYRDEFCKEKNIKITKRQGLVWSSKVPFELFDATSVKFETDN